MKLHRSHCGDVTVYVPNEQYNHSSAISGTGSLYACNETDYAHITSSPLRVCLCSRQVGHLAKGFGTSTFTKQDIAKLKQFGNEVHCLLIMACLQRSFKHRNFLQIAL